MKPEILHFLNGETNQGIQEKFENIDRSFVNKEVFKDEDLDRIAFAIAEEIKISLENLKKYGEFDEKEEAEFILKILESNKFWENPFLFEYGGFFMEESQPGDPPKSIRLWWIDRGDQRYSDILKKEELDLCLEEIRSALIKKLEKLLPKNTSIQLIKKSYNYITHELQNGDYFKDKEIRIPHEYREAENTNKIKALIRLQEILELSPSPLIYFGIKKIGQEGETIIKKTELYTLDEELQNQSELDQLIKYVIDVIDALIFIYGNSLRISDLRPNNIGINKKTKRAFLFDLDGLRCKEDKGIYIFGEGFRPPERSDSNPSLITPEENIYELGEVLRIIEEKIKSKRNAKNTDERKIDNLHQISVEMKEEHPERRPSIKDIRSRLFSLISE